jgi:hypothetical protein
MIEERAHSYAINFYQEKLSKLYQYLSQQIRDLILV